MSTKYCGVFISGPASNLPSSNLPSSDLPGFGLALFRTYHARIALLTVSSGGIEALVMPKVTLSARRATATVSANEAAFINGVFSREVVMSDFGLAQLAVDNITAQYQAGDVAFILPGVNILIFPIGLIITSIWTVLGFAAYGFGTYERYAYRDAYRRRKARELIGSTGRI